MFTAIKKNYIGETDETEENRVSGSYFGSARY